MVAHEKFIFWDWNGTLLDDAHTCLDTMNRMLSRRRMPLLDLSAYREVFGFPVAEYYQQIGFDFNVESFETLSVEFIDGYQHALPTAPLVSGTTSILDYYKKLGKENIIISAMKQDMLLQSVLDKQVDRYFTKIMGIDTIYAHSKSQMAIDFVKDHNIHPKDVVFIGDTLHDYEVACEIGCRCILVSHGHQSAHRLRKTGARVIGSLSELVNSEKLI